MEIIIADQDEAVATFDAIVSRDQAVFEALGALLACGVAVTIVLGNHDVELSLPAVRGQLHTLLGTESGDRVQIIYDGEAYVIGDVLIEHGNRYDGWNVVDHDRLRRFRSECSRRLDISPEARFFPPAGSELVERIMNPIKEDYPFIDLLKPETDAALPLLLALEPSLASAANGIEAIRLGRQALQHGPVAPARPARSGDIASTVQSLGPLQNILQRRLGASDRDELLALVNEAETETKGRGSDIAASAMSRGLSFARLRISGAYEKRLRILLRALQTLQDDQSFERSVEMEPAYLSAAQELAAKGFSTIVFGHTHLAKEVGLAGGAKYLNTGTWADLMRLPGEILHGSPESAMQQLARFAEAIRVRQFHDYILFQPTFAQIQLDAHGRTVSARVTDFEPGKVGEA